ncbi:MAG TPA: TonB-dependent receptor [Candidatus Baltobacteraceae bacterium]|jgi:hypothetical protein|nr:TonB-dependent receptor [Candidatus Baltobacteraceae bacterium]
MLRFSRSCAALISLALAMSFLTPIAALAGTTGSLSARVVESDSRAPIAGARVEVSSPSQNVSATTDASGLFSIISLVPDTYTVSISKPGFNPISVNGIAVFADQNQTLSFTLVKNLREIARVTSRSSLNPVRSGTTGDVYSVNPAMAAAAAPIGGGGGLNNAYSAIAAMPGAFVPPGQMGVNQTVYIRGGYYDQIGYEYDGVPVNRSFDNYPAHSASTLGQQELQIYTGGGPASANATGLAGFINQVVKSGTYPGFASVSGRAGSPAFYHDLSVEAGGSTPNRQFSYYVGLSGFNQDFRYLTNQNGVGLADEFPVTWPSNVTTNLSFWPAVYPTCNTTDPSKFYTNPAAATVWSDPGCFSSMNPNFGNISSIYGREIVANFHFGIPHKTDGGRDDVQLLFTNSAQFRQYYNSALDANPLLNTLQGDLQANGNDLGAYAYQPMWPDFYTFPSNTAFMQPATAQPIAYPFPGSPAGRCYNTDLIAGQDSAAASPITVPNQCAPGQAATLPNNYRDGRWDQASIFKLQYQKNIGGRAYVRAFGYTFYSNTNRSGAVQQGISGPFGTINLGATNFDYEVDAHTSGGQLQFADQINDTNQIQFSLNYVTSKTYRYYNFNDFNVGGAPTNDFTGSGGQMVSNLTNGTNCYAAYDGTLANGVDTATAGQLEPCNDPITQGSFSDLTGNSDYSSAGQPQNVNCSGGPNDPIPAGACANGASWRMTYLGQQASINAVTPKFTNVSLTDVWRPNDKFNIDMSVRFDRDEFDLSPVAGDPGKDFWYARARQEFCYNPQTLQPLIIPQAAQFLKDVTPYVTLTCPVADGVQTVHPDGQNGHLLLTDQFDPTYVQTYFSPRFGLTYTLDPNTVLRFSAGKFAQEPQNYEVEYNSVEPNLAAQLIGFLPFGYNTPFHGSQAQFSNNYDFSIEHHFPKTDIAFKATPYYRYATNQLYETVSIPTLFGVSPSFNAGTESTYGIELQVTKGDFDRNGFAGQLAWTYTNSKEKWQNYGGTNINPVDPYNQDIQQFNLLTQAGGGAKCYLNDRSGTADPSCGPTSILNPYYTMKSQPLLDKNAYYETGLDFPYISPNTFALIVNYKHDKFAITPVFSLNQGATYGTPSDFQGNDPRSCKSNQGAEGIAGAPSPLTADYTSCKSAQIGASGTSPGHLYIPSPYTGSFDTFGQFRQPWQFNMALQLNYAFSPRITGNIVIANLINHCFGGSAEPWTAIYPPSGSNCGYSYNKFFISNYYNGSSPNDTAANGVPLNKYFAAPFIPAYGDVNSFNLPLPLQLYFQLQIKL